MSTEVGELLVGAYLKVVERCDFVGYNVRPTGGGLKGLGELDVVGFQFANHSAFLCEVTTHIGGLLIRNPEHTIGKLEAKFKRQKEYAESHLREFPTRRYQFWSPVVSQPLAARIRAIDSSLEVIVNAEYAARVDRLREEAKRRMNDEGNPVFRVLQILEHLRRV
jgi:hypothetical protein